MRIRFEGEFLFIQGVGAIVLKKNKYEDKRDY
jgi:hypothetical protein